MRTCSLQSRCGMDTLAGNPSAAHVSPSQAPAFMLLMLAAPRRAKLKLDAGWYNCGSLA